jgi:RimJ/RimL family protein N-acetyltransferase
MAEAVTTVADYLFVQLGRAEVRWECVVGNYASAAVARATGFRFTGERPAELTFRDGTHPMAWHGELPSTDRERKHGWPESTS